MQNKIGKKAVLEGAKASAKEIKKLIPSRVKDARKAVGYRFNRKRVGNAKGVATAKVGMGVGKQTKVRRAKRKVRNAAIKAKRIAAGRKGVGIAGENIHWFVLGTKKRRTRIRRTGRMRADPDLQAVVKQGTRNADPERVIAGVLKTELSKVRP
jgi:hypothetical protein